MNIGFRSIHGALIVALSLTALNLIAGGSSPARAASKPCTALKKHGKLVRPCKRTKAPTLPTNPSDGLPAVTVAPHPDTARSVTQTISPDGGTISATGADGTVYILAFAKGSLVADESITMTPLSAVDRLPSGRAAAAGVQLDPQGLLLGQPATLTIKLATPRAPADQIAFASKDSGADFHLYPQTYDPTTITMTIVHFTEYGVFPGSAIDMFTQMKYGTLSYMTLAEQFRAALAEMRNAELAGTPEPFTWDQIESRFVAVQEAWYQQQILPQMGLAVDPNADDTLTTKAISDAFAWERSIQLLGVDSPDLDAKWTKLQGMMQQALAAAYARAYNRCVNNHDLAQVERLSMLEHVMESWGFDLGPTHDFIADVQKCFHFELDVDTTYTSHVSGDGTTLDTSGHVQVTALPLVEEPYLHFLSGAKQIDYLQFAASGGNAKCTSTPAGTTLGDPFSARLSISPGGTATSTTPGIPAPVKLTLVVDPGTAKEHVHISCPRGKYDQVFDYTQFTGLWDRAAGLGRTFTEWNIAGGATYATFSSGTKTFTYEVGGETAVFTMNTTFTLRHTPG